MSKILIENYRGIDIEFDTDYEKFQCIVTDENEKESKSFTSVKKYIDDYKKNNQDFKPFYVEPNPFETTYNKHNVKVIGLRKDGRFIIEDINGKTTQLSDYDLKNYMIITDENKQTLQELKDLDIQHDIHVKNFNANKKRLISNLKITTLKDFKVNISK